MLREEGGSSREKKGVFYLKEGVRVELSVRERGHCRGLHVVGVRALGS